MLVNRGQDVRSVARMLPTTCPAATMFISTSKPFEAQTFQPRPRPRLVRLTRRPGVKESRMFEAALIVFVALVLFLVADAFMS
jgi:hypothetical protein